MDLSWMGEDCDWTLLDPAAPEGKAEGEGGEGIGGLREGVGLQGEDEVAPQGVEEEVSQCVYGGGGMEYCVFHNYSRKLWRGF